MAASMSKSLPSKTDQAPMCFLKSVTRSSTSSSRPFSISARASVEDGAKHGGVGRKSRAVSEQVDDGDVLD